MGREIPFGHGRMYKVQEQEFGLSFPSYYFLL